MKEVHIEPALLRQIRARGAADRHRIGERIAQAQRLIGQPHLHKGAGLRKLRDNYYEVRISVKERLIFENTAEALVFEMLGSHDEVRRFLKSK